VFIALFVTLFIFPLTILASVDDETCLGCHDEMEKTLSFTPHRLSSQYNSTSSDVSCISCHSNGAVHADDPSEDNIGNPMRQSGNEAVMACTECHQAHVELDNFGNDSHNLMQLNCSSCHKVHGRKQSLLVDDGAKFCLKCHADVKADFSRRSNHPLKQGNLTCLSCHKFTKKSDDNFSYDVNGVCQDCHQDKSGPFLYEHESVNAYSVEGSGCVECHAPHGSENDRLLRQPGDAICSSCHMVPQHTAVYHDFISYGCLSCHTQTHGSFTSNLFLDPDLPVKFGYDCYQGGCHSLVE
ncbi:cytochrome c3 family protein, partial [Candidatus Zixiibacteriota bacterium]